MADDVKCLRILKENVSLKDMFKEEFLKDLEENFEDEDIFPVGVAFAIQKEDITKDVIQLNYRTDEEVNNNTVMIDAQNYESVNKILNSFK